MIDSELWGGVWVGQFFFVAVVVVPRGGGEWRHSSGFSYRMVVIISSSHLLIMFTMCWHWAEDIPVCSYLIFITKPGGDAIWGRRNLRLRGMKYQKSYKGQSYDSNQVYWMPRLA